MIANHYTLGQLRIDWAASGGQRVRYNGVVKPISWLWTFWLLLAERRWVREQRTFVPVFPGQPGYEDACYEATHIYDKAEMDRLMQLHGPAD